MLPVDPSELFIIEANSILTYSISCGEPTKRFMYLAYYDESGDDGLKVGSSHLFVLSCFYMHKDSWRENFSAMQSFRKEIAKKNLLPFDLELHTRALLLGKKPYCDLGLLEVQKVEIIDFFSKKAAELKVKGLNVIILKRNIKSPKYDVLSTALTYSIQRIDNDLSKGPSQRFMIISDEGRIGSLVATARKIQKINYIPSQYGPTPYRKEIQTLIEDPLPKDSRSSHFLQLADLMSFIVAQYVLCSEQGSKAPNRLPGTVNIGKLTDWMENLKPVLNLKASSVNPYGLVIYPK